MKSKCLFLPLLLSMLLPATGGEFDQALVDETVEKMSEKGAELKPIAKITPHYLRFSAPKSFTDKDLAELKPLAEHILWLDLAETTVFDDAAVDLSAFKNLTRLNLEKTAVSDGAFDSIAGLAKLEYLNLYSTPITDVALNKLTANKKLEKLFIWQTQTTEQGVAALATALPDIDINVGWQDSSVPVSMEVPSESISSAKGSSLNSALEELNAVVEKARLKTETAKKAHTRAIEKVAEATEYADTLKAEADQASVVERKAVAALEELKKAIQAAGLSN